jgi:hypothetical protein
MTSTGSDPRRCACCGEGITRPNGDPWEGRLDAYCEECAITRCDAFPGECRREGSGHDEQTEDLARAHDLIGTLHLYITRHTETQLTTEQKELLYDIVEARYRAHGISDEPMERWWR